MLRAGLVRRCSPVVSTPRARRVAGQDGDDQRQRAQHPESPRRTARRTARRFNGPSPRIPARSGQFARTQFAGRRSCRRAGSAVETETDVATIAGVAVGARPARLPRPGRGALSGAGRRSCSSASSPGRCRPWSRWASCSSTGPTASSTSPRATSAPWPPSWRPRSSSGPTWLLDRGADRSRVAVAFGALIEIGIIRRFANAPRLQLTVATIGLAQLFQFVPLGLPKRLRLRHRAPAAAAVRLHDSSGSRSIFSGGHLLILIVVPLVAARRSRCSSARRASASPCGRRRSPPTGPRCSASR